MSTESLDLEALKELCEKATPEPWEVVRDEDKGFNVWQVNGTYVAVGMIGGAVEDESDARFIAAARSAVPALIAEVERLREAVREVSRLVNLNRDATPTRIVVTLQEILRILAAVDKEDHQ